jgi:YidC/Oxa1 family membrane protein insertase
MFNTLLVQPLFNLLALIYAILPGHDFGVAIIVMTILVRLALWPLVAKQLHSQKAMQDLAPEVARVRAEAKGDKQLESQKLMELYKEKEINPFASLIPLLIQLPLFLALFAVLKDILKGGAIAKLAYPAIKNLPAIQAVIADPAMFHTTFLGLVDLSKPSIFFAITAAIAQFFQSKQIMPAKGSQQDPSARAMSSMIYLFPGLTFIIGLSLPGALSLYWTTASVVAIIQQTILLRKDVEELEEGEDKRLKKAKSKPTEVIEGEIVEAKPVNKKKKKGKK